MEKFLLIAVLLPLVGSCVVCLLQRYGQAAVRQSALVTSLSVLLMTAILILSFPRDARTFAVGHVAWIDGVAGLNIELSLGLDGLSLWLFSLSSLLMFISVLISWESVRERPATFYSLLLILETGLLGVFSARDIILFYVFFEFTLIPLFFLIGIWGSEDRCYAAMKFFVYTLAGSMLTFLGLLAIVLWSRQNLGTLIFSIPELTRHLAQGPFSLPTNLQIVIFLALLAGFAIKVPLFPLHTWLPLAHVQAPAAGSVILAGVLLKIGTYGFLRFNMPMLPQATAIFMPYLLCLSLAGILYGALVALAQSDVKRLIAYSSVSHLGFSMLGIFSLNRLGIQGGALQMIHHGLATGGLFACVGMIYERYHTRRIDDLGGLSRRVPILACFIVVFSLSSIGLPGLGGYVGELLLLLGMFQRAWVEVPTEWMVPFRFIAVSAVLGVVLGAWYMLSLIQRIFFGPLKEPRPSSNTDRVSDLSGREILALTPLVLLILWIGVAPAFFLDRMSPTLDPIADVVNQAYENQYPSQQSSQVVTVASNTHKVSFP